MSRNPATRINTTVPLQTRVVCPHCWERFSPEAALWIAEHPDLMGDMRLGPDQPQRFLPSRFNVDCAALDALKTPCHSMACPHCHLMVPRAFFEMPPLFISMFGGPTTGKSYLLASMTWQLRRVLPVAFKLGFTDADPELNLRLHEYESMQFLNPQPDRLVRIEKTEAVGAAFYDSVQYGELRVEYPRPYVFALQPLEGHPNYGKAARASSAICLYDNGGESFQPGEDKASSPVTQHLAQSKLLLFVFDPTQDVRFRHACAGKTNDPQMVEREQKLRYESAVRQDTILLEAARRVRRYTNLAQTQKHSQPLVVVVTKHDCWRSLLPIERLPHTWVTNPENGHSAMRVAEIERVSKLVREVLRRLTPELVAAAEGFAENVLYVPVSATGCSPEIDPSDGHLKIRPRDMRPAWAETPILYALSKWMDGLVPYVREKADVGNSHDQRNAPKGQA